jgi:hypothetical protein
MNISSGSWQNVVLISSKRNVKNATTNRALENIKVNIITGETT